MSPWTHSISLAALVASALPVAVAAQTAAAHVGGEVMFVSGVAQRVEQDGKRSAVAKGMQLLEGDRVRTNGESHVYVRLRDGGLLVVRPSSELHIDLWRFDPSQPQDSRIRYTLDNGVARHVSGLAAKAARDKFRFNTPMAAIGVRGTDFTVLADPLFTRVAVQSGGVILNAIGNGCRADGLGPCEGGSAVELFATAKDKLLQLRMGERRPELIDAGSVPAPDLARPPAAGEPSARERSAPVVVDVAQTRISEIVELAAAEKEKVVAPPPPLVAPPPPLVAPPPPLVVTLPPVIVAEPVPEVVTPPVVPEAPVVVAPPPPEPPIAAWGRWAAIADKDPGVVSADDVLSGRTLIAINTAYVLGANKTATPMELPGAGVANFRLAAHDGLVTDKVTGQSLPSTASDAALSIDFGTRRFETSMTVNAGAVTADIRANGSVEKSGKFVSDPFIWRSTIQGIVGGKDAGQAMYLYQRRAIDGRYDATGAASWLK